jgi:hypothetical protein
LQATSRWTISFVSDLAKSLTPLIAAFLAVEIGVAGLLPVRVRLAPVLCGIAYDRDQGQAVSPAPIAAPNSWVRSVDAHATGSSGHELVDA